MSEGTAKRARRASATNGNGGRKAKPKANEDVLTLDSIFSSEQSEREQDTMVANMLGNIAREAERLKVLARANKHGPDDLVPGQQKTYTEARSELEVSLEAIGTGFGKEQVARARALLSQQ